MSQYIYAGLLLTGICLSNYGFSFATFGLLALSWVHIFAAALLTVAVLMGFVKENEIKTINLSGTTLMLGSFGLSGFHLFTLGYFVAPYILVITIPVVLYINFSIQSRLSS